MVKVDGSVQRDGEDSEYSELPEDVAVLGRDELRNEGKKQRSLGVQHFVSSRFANTNLETR